MKRRGFLSSILASAAAPAIVRAGSLMPIVVPTPEVFRFRCTERYVLTSTGEEYWHRLVASKEIVCADILQKSFQDQLQPFYNRGAINLDNFIQRKDRL